MKNILAKMLAISSEVEAMPKDGLNTFQNYKYLSETQVSLKMRELLNKHGVVFSHSSTITARDNWLNPKGIRQNMVDVEVTYSFYDVQSGEALVGLETGQGVDSGDKAVYKAITGAVKYIFMKNFLIPTGDDPENEKATLSKSSFTAPPVRRTTQSTTPTPNASKTKSMQSTVAIAEQMFSLKCDQCGKELKERNGSKGKFYGCSGYPKCSRTLNLDQVAGYMAAQKTDDVPVPMPPDYMEDDLPFDTK
jgi:hypothetical protein